MVTMIPGRYNPSVGIDLAHELTMLKLSTTVKKEMTNEEIYKEYKDQFQQFLKLVSSDNK